MVRGNMVWQGHGATREVKGRVGKGEVLEEIHSIDCRPSLQIFYVIYRFESLAIRIYTSANLFNQEVQPCAHFHHPPSSLLQLDFFYQSDKHFSPKRAPLLSVVICHF
jgi:hypothetical protein